VKEERMATLDDLHLAMGRFLTESSHVENMLMGLYFVCNPNSPSHSLFSKFMDETFGKKIKMFKVACNAYHFSDEHRAILTDAYTDLNNLLPKRNFIVHGSTYQLAKDGKPAQAYRIGKDRGDGEFLNHAIRNDFTGPHVFTAEGVDNVTAEFLAVRGKLGKVSVDVMTPLARKPS
jgi:hypothetical protein